MRRTLYLILASGLIGLGSVSCATFSDDCYSGKECVGAFGSGGASSTSTSMSTSSSSMTTASGTTTSTSTGMDPGCLGAIMEGLSAADAKRLISDKCGVFVQAGAASPTEDGTQAAPYRTLQKAIDNAGNKRVYACSSVMTPFAEAVAVAAPVEVYGNFDCTSGWAFKTATRSLITGAAQKVSLTLTDMADGALIEGFKITSQSATGMKGDSSVAVAVAAIDATLTECDVEAGNGADGSPGMSPTGAATNGADAPITDPQVISACINPAALTVGAPGLTTCDDGSSAGGPGGKGGVSNTNSGNGQAGSDGTPVDGTNGKGGVGQDTATQCMNGAVGKNGDPGPAGSGGMASGTLSLAGITNTSATDGTDGKSGTSAQGGGGGGGVKSGILCKGPVGSVDGNGASGGGGGAGGCGGNGGGAGKAGGSSIAIISLGTKLQLAKVTLTSGNGGKGGDGTAGQSGGTPGAGGKGGAPSAIANSKAGCKGADGGTGGSGGPGGGGRGGHSIGLAVMGIPMAKPSSFASGKAGVGGIAGTGGSPTGDGILGVDGVSKGTCFDFMNNMACK